MSARARGHSGQACAALLALLAAAAPALASACGACDEDTIAATYDHAVVRRAQRAGDAVVYCRFEGHFDRERLVAAARRVAGVRKETVRVSAAPPALSFAIDPTAQSAPDAVRAVEHAMPAGGRLMILKVVASAGRSKP